MTTRSRTRTLKAPEATLANLLSDSLRLMRREFAEHIKGSKLTLALARLLYYVHREPGLRQADLAQRLEVTPVTLGRMIDRLTARDFVYRRPDEADRRVYRVYLGKAGAPMLAVMRKARIRAEQRATAGFNDRERAELLRSLARFCENLANGGD
jgi:MarR family transcriptional regulator for hemolysin